ncbi:hypothetical protein EsDP_00007065 [Epichloe bromicola]|uniref:Nulp1-pending protein n=1 Tax=Epichloe bromicola TaxID=79588 RepID=A0ABQ0CZJ2_9HYPO
MSSRQLRKLQQQKELERAQQADQHESNESEDVEEPVQSTGRPRRNLFAALGGSADDEGEEDDDEDAGAPLTESREPPIDEPTPGAKKSKKKKKKKKKQKNIKAKSGNAESEDEDEIDKAIKQLKLRTNSTTGDQFPGQDGQHDPLGPRMRMNELLSINTYHLRAMNEMRNLFGREVIESANVEEQQEQGNRRRQRMPQQVDLETFLREPPRAKKLPQVSLRRNVFIQGREHWPRQSAGGLTMSEIGKSSDGLSTEYAYVHDKNYDAMQAFFFACVQIGDPMRIVHLLKRVPYHVSTLLQVSSVAKQDQNMALAAELCERALFTFGRVTTSAFRQDIERGRARLDFRRPENRQFWLAGYHYLRSLIRKGTYRTALEWAKLLYALDTSDPYGMRHYLHLLALRAYESTWLMDLIEQMDQLGGGHPGDIYLRQSLVLAKLQANDAEGARELLKTGVQTVPWLYCALFQELNLDAPPSIWGTHPATDTRSFWVKLYVHQTKDLWNNAQATTLLQQVTRSQERRVDPSCLPADDAAVDLGSARLAYLEGQTSLLAVAPRHVLDSQPNYEFDPLPPPEHDNIFTGEGTHLPWRERRQQSQGQTDELMARMQNLPAPREDARAGWAGGAQAGQAGLVGFMNNFGGGGGDDDDDDDDDDDETRALRAADDEELRRDIEAHMNWGNEPGVLGTLMQMLGVGRGTNDGEEDDEGEDDVPPGAWPEEQ